MLKKFGFNITDFVDVTYENEPRYKFMAQGVIGRAEVTIMLGTSCDNDYYMSSQYINGRVTLDKLIDNIGGVGFLKPFIKSKKLRKLYHSIDMFDMNNVNVLSKIIEIDKG